MRTFKDNEMVLKAFCITSSFIYPIVANAVTKVVEIRNSYFYHTGQIIIIFELYISYRQRDLIADVADVITTSRSRMYGRFIFLSKYLLFEVVNFIRNKS